jgi:hypothetical protein
MNQLDLRSSVVRGKFILNKHSPELFLGAGIVGLFTSGVLAYRAFLESQKAVEGAKVDWFLLKTAMEEGVVNEDNYTSEMFMRDRMVVTFRLIADIGRICGPSVLLAVLSSGMLIGSNRIMNGRNVAIATAYKGLDEAFRAYRNRVQTEFGEDVDRYLRYREPYKGEMEIVDPTKKGKKRKINLEDVEEQADLPGEIMDHVDTLSPYAQIFDDRCGTWQISNQYNEFFLRGQQNYANELLRLNGHLFLNEVHDMLGMDRTQAGSVVGWVDGYGDGFVSFDIWNPYNSRDSNVLNADNTQFVLDFNVQGVIYNMI